MLDHNLKKTAELLDKDPDYKALVERLTAISKIADKSAPGILKLIDKVTSFYAIDTKSSTEALMEDFNKDDCLLYPISNPVLGAHLIKVYLYSVAAFCTMLSGMASKPDYEIKDEIVLLRYTTTLASSIVPCNLSLKYINSDTSMIQAERLEISLLFKGQFKIDDAAAIKKLKSVGMTGDAIPVSVRLWLSLDPYSASGGVSSGMIDLAKVTMHYYIEFSEPLKGKTFNLPYALEITTLPLNKLNHKAIQGALQYALDMCKEWVKNVI